MESTYIRDTPNSRIRYATTFGGINRANGTPLGEWDNLKGFDLTAYPALRTCLPYVRNSLPTGITGYTFRNGSIVYTVSDGIYVGGEKIAIKGLTSGEKTLVSLGAYILILPDEVLVNLATEPISVSFPTSHELTDGVLYEYNQNQTQPTVAIFKRLYVDVKKDSEELSHYSEDDQVRVSYTYGGKKKTLTAKIDSITEEEYTADGCVSINLDTTKYSNTYRFYIEGGKWMTTSRIVSRITGASISRLMPKMDFIVEYNNRLWGCSSENHEIYCSKLGSAIDWGTYDGISTDAWTATVGTDGDFTGACVFNGCVLFFKEDCVHSVYGTKASNFTITTYTVRGVQKGSSKSLCISEGLLYYKAPEGIFSFNGSASSRADMKLSCDITQTACGTADDRYIVMLMSDGTAYYYDKLHSVWYTRYLADAVSAHNIGGKLYAVTKSDDGTMAQVLLTGADSMAFRDNETAFEAVTGELCRGELMSTSSYTRKAMHTVIKKLTMSLEEWHQKGVSAVNFALAVQYDGGDWQTVYSYDGTEEATDGNVVTLVPIIPMRCQRLRIKISGTLTASSKASVQPYLKLYGLFIDTEEASEIGGKH